MMMMSDLCPRNKDKSQIPQSGASATSSRAAVDSGAVCCLLSRIFPTSKRLQAAGTPGSTTPSGWCRRCLDCQIILSHNHNSRLQFRSSCRAALLFPPRRVLALYVEINDIFSSTEVATVVTSQVIAPFAERSNVRLNQLQQDIYLQ